MPYTLSREAERDLFAMYMTGAEQFGADQASLYH